MQSSTGVPIGLFPMTKNCKKSLKATKSLKKIWMNSFIIEVQVFGMQRYFLTFLLSFLVSLLSYFWHHIKIDQINK